MSELAPEERLERLMRRLRSADDAVRIHAALRLTGEGIDAARARPALTEALNDGDPEVRRLAAWTLARLGA